MVERANKPSAISAPSLGPQPTVDFSQDKTRIIANLPSGDSVEILLHGATVISWKTSGGQENLWLSDKAVLDGSKPVRGGIPLVFPVFGPPPKNHATSSLPHHGFARSSKWEFLGRSTSESDPINNASSSGATADTSVKLDFGLSSSMLSQDAKAAWPSAFGLTYSITLSKGRLQTMLNVQNNGQESFEFQMLMHSYFLTPDISKTSVAGLMGVKYVDKMLNATEHTEKETQIKINGEVDRVYSSIPQDTTTILVDEKPRLDVTRDRLSDTVLWNPWVEKSKGMGDFEPKDGYKNMVCVEVGSVDGWQKLEPNDTFEAGQIIKSHL